MAKEGRERYTQTKERETKETCNEKKNKIETNRKCEILKFSHFKK